MKFRIVLEYDADANLFSTVCPELSACASAADTQEEARRNITEAIELYLQPTEIDPPHDAKIADDDAFRAVGRQRFEAAYAPEDAICDELIEETAPREPDGD